MKVVPFFYSDTGIIREKAEIFSYMWVVITFIESFYMIFTFQKIWCFICVPYIVYNIFVVDNDMLQKSWNAGTNLLNVFYI